MSYSVAAFLALLIGVFIGLSIRPFQERRDLIVERQRLWAVLLACGGAVRVPESVPILTYWKDYELKEWRDVETGDYVFRLVKIKPENSLQVK